MMSIVSDLASDPTSPGVSAVLTEAAAYADDGWRLAVTRAAYGSTTVDDYLCVVTPSHTMAWGFAILLCAQHLDPAVPVRPVLEGWGHWSDFSAAFHSAWDVLETWERKHDAGHLRQLLTEAASTAREMEGTDG
ncbi:hypothetical protein [Streptomyces tsukubensis]|uniref:hypothetical protein n=1 Tax=Streptomyces tsukubensis TaxID=83656 RepID=UPI0034501D68